MDCRAASRYVVVGAGMHGLSTALHLAGSFARAGSAREATSSCSRSRRPGPGRPGIACGVVRNNYFQPAMSELMQACVEVWESDPEAYHYNGVGYIALGPQVQEPDLIAVAERQERIGYRSELIVGEAEVDAHMKRLFPDWRAQGRHRLPARAPGRLRVQPRVGRRPARQVPRRGRADPRAHRGDRLRARRRRRGHGGRDEHAATSRSASRSSSPPARGRRSSGRCSGCPTRIDVHTPSGDVARDQPMWTYWNLQEGEITVDPLMFDDRRRRRAAGDPPRHRRAAVHGRRRARHRRAVGHLLQARPPRRAGRRLAADRRRRRRARPVPVDDRRRPDLPRHVVRGALARDDAASRAAGRSTSWRARAASAPSPPTTSPSSTGSSRTSTRCSTRTTATR